MDVPKIHESEYRFCQVLWDYEPVSAAELARLCLKELGWKRTTTYTVIKRLGERGILQNDEGVVTARISREEAEVSEIDELMEKKFGGSAPAFLAAFTRRQKLSDADLEEVQRMIDRMRKGETG